MKIVTKILFGIVVGAGAPALAQTQNIHRLGYGYEKISKNANSELSESGAPYHGAFIDYHYAPDNAVNVRLGLDVGVMINDPKKAQLASDDASVSTAAESFVQLGYRLASGQGSFALTPLVGVRATESLTALKEQSRPDISMTKTSTSAFLVGAMAEVQVSSGLRVGLGGEYHLTGVGAYGQASQQTSAKRSSHQSQGVELAGRHYMVEVPVSYMVTNATSVNFAYAYAQREIEGRVNPDQTSDLGGSKLQFGLAHRF